MILLRKIKLVYVLADISNLDYFQPTEMNCIREKIMYRKFYEIGTVCFHLSESKERMTSCCKAVFEKTIVKENELLEALVKEFGKQCLSNVFVLWQNAKL